MTTSDLPQAWADLLEALTLLAKHQNNDVSPFNCSHDTLTVMADPAAFTPKELARLDELGFIANGDDEVFTSFRFGSA
jgi:hypothetical protein